MEPLNRRRGDQITASEAAQWHVRQGQLDKDEREAFTAWLKESPRHLREFLIMETLGEQLKHVDPQRQHDVQALLVQSSNEVVSLQDAEKPFARDNTEVSRPRWRALAIAAGVAIAVVGGWLCLPLLSGWQDFTTTIGEQRTLRLQDNSIVNLNTGSHLRVKFSPAGRDIRLVEGEALFKVQQDAARPFRVHTRDAVIQAIGTQFNVRRRTNDTTVAVIEGRVHVASENHHTQVPASPLPAQSRPDDMPSSAALSAGEEANIASSGRIHKRATPDAVNVTAWQQRRLVFRENSLGDIVAEFNRYNHTPKIELAGLDGSTQHYTGTFDADNPRSLATLLATQSDLKVEITEERIVIRPR